MLAALMAGNSVLLKPALETVLVGWHLASRSGRRASRGAAAVRAVPGRRGRPRADHRSARGGGRPDRRGQTARLFLEWRPDLRLFAETSGKNAIIVTALADRDQAIKDLVRSAFGHAGQKCSAASLAICEAEVYDDPGFRRQLRDAAASLAGRRAWEREPRHAADRSRPRGALRRALTTLDEGEKWLLEPRPIGGDPRLWSPGHQARRRAGLASSTRRNASARSWA